MFSALGKVIVFLRRWTAGLGHARWLVAAVVFAGAISGLCNAALLGVANAALHQQGEGRRALAASFAALLVLMPAVRLLAGYLSQRLAAKAALDLRVRLSRRILATPLRDLESHGPARLLATLNDDVPAITGALTSTPFITMHACVVLGCLTYLGMLSLPVLGLTLAAIALGVLVYQLPVQKAMHHTHLTRDNRDAMMRDIHTVVEGAKELKLHHHRREAFFRESLEPAAAAFHRNTLIGNTLFLGADIIGNLLFFVLIGLMLFVGSLVWPFDEQVLSGYTLVVLFIIGPLSGVLGTLPELGRAAAAVEKVERLGLALDGEADMAGASGKPALEIAAVARPSWHAIELVGVSHTYRRDGDDEHFTLGPIDLAVRQGELLFLVGGNGSGKTTLAKLLVGLYVPEGGEIRLDGRAIDDAGREAYRQLFSVVFSDFFLFDKFLGLPQEGLDTQARRYLEQLRLEKKVAVRDGGLSSLELSQGQRKRLALLTAYLEDRPVYLFDEWAADQDPEFKEVFYRELLPELRARGKAVVVISHDDRYYGAADRVVKLEMGRVIYDGPADALGAGLAGRTEGVGR